MVMTVPKYHKLFYCPNCKQGWQKDISHKYGVHLNGIVKYGNIPSYGLIKENCADCRKEQIKDGGIFK